MRRQSIVAVLLAGAALVGTRSASAQEQPGFAANHFTPAERGSRWFVLDSLDIRGNGRLALGVLTDYSYRPLVDYNASGNVSASIVRNQLFAHVGATMTLAERVRVGVNMPVQLFADGHTATINGTVHRPAEEVAAGDVRLATDVRLAGEYGDAAVLALGTELYVPVGSQTAYTGDGSPRLAPRVLFAGRSSSIVYAAKLGATIRGREEAWGDGQIGHTINFGLSGGVEVMNGKMIIGPELFGHTVLSGSQAFEGRTTPLEALLGTHVDLGSDLRLGAGFGFGLTRGYGAPVARGLLGLEWVPGDAKPPEPEKVADRDGDGISDCEDACSYVAGVKSADPTKNGCPADSDSDGVPDVLDACKDVPGIRTAEASTNGCPADLDHDGVPDGVDACPKEPGPRTDDPKTNGCPPVVDQDADGIPDKEDACPKEAGQRTTDPKTNGCPDPDRDKDGIPNATDACPDAAGPADPDPKKNGCPKARIEGASIKITDQVKFKTASAEIIGKESDAVLTAVLDLLKAHPEIKKVRVEGHTDKQGDAAKNKELSKKRAESVVKWLTDKGIDKSRLAAEGFGEEKPIATNDTEEGRTENRRVEFHVEQGSGR